MSERERLLRCSEPECPVQVVVMLPSARAWHRHRGGILVEMAEVFPLVEGQAALVPTSSDDESLRSWS
jgi:hypothetical protein